MRKRILALICAFCLCCTLFFFVPVSAEAIAGATVIDLDEPTRIYNDDDTVTCTYDIPLTPYSFITGLHRSTESWVRIGESTNIYFTQDKDESIVVFTTLSSGSVSSTTSGSSSDGRFWTSAYMEPEAFDYTSVTHLAVNGVFYPVEYYSDANWLVKYDTAPSAGSSYDGRYILYSNFVNNIGNPAWSFMSAERLDADILVGYYEDFVISEREYDSLFIDVWPLGYNPDTSRGNLIKISDLRSGSNFTVDVTVDANIQLENSTEEFKLTYFTYFYDEYGNELEFDRQADVVTIDAFSGSQTLHNTFTFTVPEGASYFDIQFTANYFNVEDVVLLDWRMASMEVTVDLSAVESNSQMMEGIQDKLDDIGSAIEDTNEKVDNIEDAITAPADPVAPEGGSAVDDLDQAEDQLLDNVGSGLNNVGAAQNQASAGVSQYASGFAFLAAGIDHCVAEMEWLQYLLYISLSVGTVGAILGVVPGIFRSRGSSGEHKKGGD